MSCLQRVGLSRAVVHSHTGSQGCGHVVSWCCCGKQHCKLLPSRCLAAWWSLHCTWAPRERCVLARVCSHGDCHSSLLTSVPGLQSHPGLGHLGSALRGCWATLGRTHLRMSRSCRQQCGERCRGGQPSTHTRCEPSVAHLAQALSYLCGHLRCPQDPPWCPGWAASPRGCCPSDTVVSRH